MKKTAYLVVLLTICAIVIEALPSSAVLIFASGPNTRIPTTFSYFSTTPFGYANFGPLLTAILSCLILVQGLAGLFLNRNPIKSIRKFSIAAVVTSLMPLMYGLDYYNINAFIITLMLALVAAATFKPDLFDTCSCC